MFVFQGDSTSNSSFNVSRRFVAVVCSHSDNVRHYNKRSEAEEHAN
jgi:hypothetical protein